MTDAPDVRKLQWKLLEDCLGYLHNAEFEVRRGDPGAGEMWLGDIRRCLGELALTLAEDPDAAGYAKLLEHVLTEPKVPRR